MAKLEGTMFLSGTRTLYVGGLVATEKHAHHAAQIVVAPEGLDLEDGAGGHILVRAAVIPPHVVHGHGATALGALLFLDGDDVASRELRRRAEPRVESWRRDSIETPLSCDPTADEARALLAAILGATDLQRAPGTRHPATRRMCALLDGDGPVDLAALSREAGLSPRQMRDAFARDVGLSMRAYLRWKRLRRAIDAVERGASLSDAAIAAGFADSAHLSRVFREQFGMTPTQGLAAVKWRTLD